MKAKAGTELLTAEPEVERERVVQVRVMRNVRLYTL